ncbi:hypothetical protein HMPREF3206_01019 [Fusobacterium equinum]|uniref:Uncharacterized protein n=1 Tax=Fusobacterium equinum TaxID=134605 RepID=A0A133NDF8_9FUSO|nr:hypothetical protein HMPREF3206_01019 [Fusobacterium equinum]
MQTTGYFTFQCVSIKVVNLAKILAECNVFTFQCVSIKVKNIKTDLSTEQELYISMCFY